jgi:thiamine biosynthesis protein ThiS
MELTVNGEPRSIDCHTITDLLIALTIDPRRVAVELNLEIVPKNMYESKNLNNGDKIEIVHFVGGG